MGNELSYHSTVLSSIFGKRRSANDPSIVFENCDPDTKLFGEKLETIVGILMNNLGIRASLNSNAERIYRDFCNGIEKSIQSSGKCELNRSIDCSTVNNNRSRLLNELFNLVPHRFPKFDRMIEKAADEALQALSTEPTNPFEIIYFENKTEFSASEFCVLKVFLSGKDLEIIPCFLYAKARNKISRFTFFENRDSDVMIEFKQQKYVLTEDYIGKMITKAAADASRNSWSEDSDSD